MLDNNLFEVRLEIWSAEKSIVKRGQSIFSLFVIES